MRPDTARAETIPPKRDGLRTLFVRSPRATARVRPPEAGGRARYIPLLRSVDRDLRARTVDADDCGIRRHVERAESAVLDRARDGHVARQGPVGQADRQARDRRAGAEAV